MRFLILAALALCACDDGVTRNPWGPGRHCQYGPPIIVDYGNGPAWDCPPAPPEPEPEPDPDAGAD